MLIKTEVFAYKIQHFAYELISLAATKICTKLQNCTFAIAVIFYPVIITL